MPTPLSGDPTWLGDLALNVIDDDGVEWTVTDNPGWPGSPATTLTVTQRQSDHGGYPSGSWLTPRNLTLAVTIHAPSQAQREQAVEALKAAASLSATSLRVLDAAYDRTATVRRQGETLVTRLGNDAEASMLLIASDPRLYSSTGYTGTCNLPSLSGGLVLPVTPPFTISAVVASGAITVANAGSIGARPLLRITGPATTPVVTLQLPDGSIQQLTFNAALGALDYLDLDCDQHTATLNGTAGRRGLLTVTGGWPEIPPTSSCQLYFNASTYSSAATLSAAWSDAWE